MPELPEVETVCRTLRKAIGGCKIVDAKAVEDALVMKGASPDRVRQALEGSTVKEIGRKGKYFWICFDRPPCLMVHFGMSGWADVLPPDAPNPKFLKLMLDFGSAKVAFTDARRLGRIWLAEDPAKDPQVKALGPDSLTELPPAKKLMEVLRRRKTPIKAVLLDQKTFAGVGNYLADEVLYQARIAPTREASELTEEEVTKLRGAIKKVVATAVEADADETKFPDTWLFHHRWGGKRGAAKIGRYDIVRETVAGRTTAWVPALQK